MLKKLEDIRDFTMAKGSPDLRGWEVYDKDGERVACVDSMIVDTKLEKGNRMFVRYLAIKHEEMEHLIPIEKADIDQENRRVNLRDLDREALMNAPEYHGEAYHEDEACRLRASFFKEQKEKEFVSAEPEKPVEEIEKVEKIAKPEAVEFESSEPERRRRFSEGAAPEAKGKMESDAQRERFLEWKRRQQ